MSDLTVFTRVSVYFASFSTASCRVWLSVIVDVFLLEVVVIVVSCCERIVVRNVVPYVVVPSVVLGPFIVF